MWILPRKRYLYAVLVFVLCSGSYEYFAIRRLVDKTLDDERSHLTDKFNVPFEKKILNPHLAKDVQILQSSREARDLVVFRDQHFCRDERRIASDLRRR
jgi:hypothetical protein